MHPYPFTYHKPASLPEAIALLGEHGESGKLLAGGHSLLPVMKLRLAEPGHIIDITGLSDLAGIRENGETIEIGALTTHSEIVASDVLKARLGLLPAIAHVIGDQQVRNRGTFGGALAHADAAADYPAGVLATGGDVIAAGPSGERTIAIDSFFQGFLTTALEPNEVLTGVRIPAFAEGTGYAYEKLANPASGYAIVAVAAVATLGENGTIATARIGITGTAEMAYRPTSVEQALVGGGSDDATLKTATSTATDGVDVLGDIHAPSDYRARVTRNLVRRAVANAVARIS